MQAIEQKQGIQEITLETLARSFFQESYTYGFNLSDYLRFINLLLDFALNSKGKTGEKEKPKNKSKKFEALSLPLDSKSTRTSLTEISLSKKLKRLGA